MRGHSTPQPDRQAAPKTKRLPTSAYKHAAEIAELLSNPDTPEDVRDRIEDALLELSGAARVTVFHPELVRAAFLLMNEATRGAYFAGDTDRVNHMARLNGELHGLVRAAKEGKPLPPSRNDREAGTAPVERYSASDSPAEVIARHRIAELQRRLDGLYEPSDEAARFKVLREIHDLQHGLTIDADEWPDVIYAGGDQ